MKFLMTAILFLSVSNVSAQTPKNVTIREIKEHLKTINTETTCMDEYLARRKQLIVKLSLSPVIAVAGTVASTYVGGATAAAIATARGVEGWSGLGYTIGGAALGAAGGAVAVGVDTTITGVTLANNVLITKAVAEQHLGREGILTEKLYKKYLKKSKVDLSKEEFVEKLIKADETGELCDGSMVKQPRIKIGTKLKFKIAKLKDLVRFIDQDRK